MVMAVESAERRAPRIVPPRSARARAWNQRIRGVVRPETPGKLPFFCECGMDYCSQNVWLTLHEARDVIEGGGLMIGAHLFRDLEALVTR